MTTPLRSLYLPARPGHTAPLLCALLPGAGDRPEHYLEHGCIAAARERGLDVDFLLLETALDRLIDGAIVHALEAALAPQRAGRRQCWLGGISLGALVALMHADAYPQAADRHLLLAPYPGNRTITADIAAAGGLAAWQAGTLPAGEIERRGWRALQRLAGERAPWLGYGRDDRFAAGHALMAAVLPQAQVHIVDGGHDWAAWRALWATFLAGGALEAGR